MKMLMFALAAGLGASAVPAGAAMVRAQDPQSVVAALQKAGYRARLDTDKTGDPVVRSASSGTDFSVFFYNCTDHKDCRTVEFYSGYHLDKNPVGLDKMNDWNRTMRFGRAYLDDQKDPVLEMDVDLDAGGMSDDLFKDNLDYWTSVMSRFEKHIGWTS
ncbi:MAG TPA: YbjN domain-containing protein [Allosphingosinicella sp.]|nr:YbjN domain-containing protein [Allosphingosinicella sp.]